MRLDNKKVEEIAKVCHEANKAYCETIGEFTQLHWDSAPEWQKESAIKGVEFKLNNPAAGNSAQHEAWLKDKEAEGWVYGEVKDAEKKTHPCIVPYDELPEEQKKKDALFTGIVNALTSPTTMVIVKLFDIVHGDLSFVDRVALLGTGKISFWDAQNMEANNPDKYFCGNDILWLNSRGKPGD